MDFWAIWVIALGAVCFIAGFVSLVYYFKRKNVEKRRAEERDRELARQAEALDRREIAAGDTLNSVGEIPDFSRSQFRIEEEEKPPSYETVVAAFDEDKEANKERY